MQLNNTSTGQIIRLAKVSNTGIAYDLYQNGLITSGERLAVSDTIDESYVPDVTMSINDLKEYLAYEILATKHTGFEESDDVKNWCIEKGSTGIDTTIRVFIPANLVSENVYTSSPLGQLMEAMQPLQEFAIRNDVGVVQYLEELLPEDRAILEMYNNIIIENK